MMTFPVSLGGVIYPDGEIPQNILKGLCDGYITEEESAVAQDAFVKKLAQHGRPSDPACVEVLFGQSLKDLGHLKSAPWSNTLDEPLIWQKSGDDDLYRGWWTVVKSDVLMRMPFDGDCKQGLTTLEITRVLAGRSNPHVELLQWVPFFLAGNVLGDRFAHQPVRRAMACVSQAFHARLGVIVDLDRHGANSISGHSILHQGIARYYLTILAVEVLSPSQQSPNRRNLSDTSRGR